MSLIKQIREQIQSTSQREESESEKSEVIPISIPEAILSSKKTSRETKTNFAYQQLLYKQKMLHFRKTHDVAALEDKPSLPGCDPDQNFL